MNSIENDVMQWKHQLNLKGRIVWSTRRQQWFGFCCMGQVQAFGDTIGEVITQLSRGEDEWLRRIYAEMTQYKMQYD